MKKYIRIILIGLVALLLVNCGEFIPSVGLPGIDVPATDSPPPDDPASDPTAFTVSLRFAGKPYIPKEEMKAQWTDGVSVFTADFGEDGVARVAGLDGDYNVKLHGLPEIYVYNPNAYTATNDERNIVIDIYKPIRTSGYGTGPYDSIEITKAGVYRVKIDGPDHKVFFQYAPPTSGSYWVESWVSTAEGNYNPKVDVYNGTSAYKIFAYTLNGGGICDGYTQNFKHIVEIADEQIGQVSQAVFTFAVHADSKNGVYPIYVDFAVSLNGSFSLEHLDKEIIIPNENFSSTPEYEGYTFKWAETETIGIDGRLQFDGDMFKLWPVSEGGDGYYHIYNKDTGEYGEILYAKISKPHRFTEYPFTTIEDSGNSSLTVNGYQNHKLLIMGIQNLLVDNLVNDPRAAGPYFCIHGCLCREDRDCIGVCGESCEKCSESCRHLPDEIMKLLSKPYYCVDNCQCKYTHTSGVCDETCTKCNKKCSKMPKNAKEKLDALLVSDSNLPKVIAIDDTTSLILDAVGRYVLADNRLLGYSDFTNSDGVYAVTEEIKYFLQSFSITQRYFADGEGWVETHPDHRVDAKEHDQWLFACGYYVKNQ